MTVILILLCLAIAARELYNASDKRLPRAQAEIAELRLRLDERDQVLRELQSRLPARPDGSAHPAGAGITSADTGGTETAGADTGRIDELSKRVEELTERTQEVRERLTELERHQAEDRQAHHGLAASLDATEALLGQVHRHLLHRLDQAADAGLGAEPLDTVRGLLRGRSVASREPLDRLYERFAAGRGLRIELREDTAGPPWSAHYFLSGPAPRELERDFIALVSELRTCAPGTGDGVAGTAGAPSADSVTLRSLALGLHGAEGGTAQIGPLVIVQTGDALLCGVLPLADLQGAEADRLLGDPDATAERLRALPEGRFCDLTGLPQQMPATGA